jgi:hypothetical protein
LSKHPESTLDSFDRQERIESLRGLLKKARTGEITLAAPNESVNIHCHTFFSFNSYGYSPTHFAWLAKKAGLAVAGITDFDVLDGLEEFLEACSILHLKGTASIETRVYVPEFGDKVINSPGEPGISYHMGVGMPRAEAGEGQRAFLARLKDTAQQRNRELMGRVNKYLSPVELDYEQDLVPLTPAANPTERHMCVAYARKAQQVFCDKQKLADYWTQKLGTDAKALGLPEGGKLLDVIRLKTMKKGGVGYVQPDKGSFPTMQQMNEFVQAAGGISTHTWLNGLSDGEKEIEGLLEVGMATGVAAINVIPDRNYAPGVADEKLTNLHHVVELSEKIGLPVVMGTEMNSPGQKFVDDFDSAELKPLAPVFLKGAHIVYAHSVLQRNCGMGYTSEWAKESFRTRADKNEFYRKVGAKMQPERMDVLKDVGVESKPLEIIDLISR